MGFDLRIRGRPSGPGIARRHTSRAESPPAPGLSGPEGPCPAYAPPTWSSASEAVGVCMFRPNRRRIALIALVVGSLLVGINQGGILASGQVGWVVWVRVALDYLTPACVSTLGVLAGSRRPGAVR